MMFIHPTLVRRLVDSAPKALRARPLASTFKYPLHWRLASYVSDERFSDFDMSGKVFVVTGAGGKGRGLGLCMAEGLVEAGGTVHCFDLFHEADEAFAQARDRLDPKCGGGLEYHQVDVTKSDQVEETISNIAAQGRRLDGLIAAAGIQKAVDALDYPLDKLDQVLDVNYKGVFFSARPCARQMYKYKIQDGSICLVASMSGSIANKGFNSPVYNSSKAAVVALTRNLAMEWGRKRDDKSGGIRVNSLSPGHINTPMVQEDFKKRDANRLVWEENSMLGRISEPEEYKAVALFLMGRGSSFMTGSNIIMDGGCTAW